MGSEVETAARHGMRCAGKEKTVGGWSAAGQKILLEAVDTPLASYKMAWFWSTDMYVASGRIFYRAAPTRLSVKRSLTIWKRPLFPLGQCKTVFA